MSNPLIHNLIRIYDKCYAILSKYRDWSSKITIKGEIGKSRNLVVVLAGYKQQISPLTLKRLTTHKPNDWDLCILTAGKYDSNLADFCIKNNYCYLSTQKNKTGLALNIAIKVHSMAEWICKIDEDIFISEDFFPNLKNGYMRIKEQGDYNPGAVAPVLNVNGVTYRIFLEKMSLLSAYQQEFHEKLVSCEDVNIHHNPDAAKWIWDKSLPFDITAKHFSNTDDYTPVPTRFSIGAILFERELWQSIDGFRSSWASGTLGTDEEHFCKECLNRSRPIIALHNTFAGHFSFGPQEAVMLNNLSNLSQKDPETFCL